MDHGKTALVRAMTGVDTDRLKEEKDRGISIELGFAYLNLPGGRRAGIVDVPGHERFIKNMLAGAGGFDLVLMVIAADEGVMPQTREHLDIIQLLQVNKGIVVLSKVDLVEEDWLELVQEDINIFLKGTVLEDAPMIMVSAVTRQGIPELLELIEQVAKEVKPRFGVGPPRLPVDRVFSITGFGTVVTGTLLSGFIRTGDVVEILPQGLSSRVRSIQVHGEKMGMAEAGQRVAVNLAGLELEQIERGSVVAEPKSMIPSQRLDVRLLLLKSSARSLKHRARVRFYLGSGETLGRVLLLDREELQPGSLVYAQLELEEKTVAAKGDRFVIRSYSPMMTIGGGSIIDPLPRRKHRRFREEVLKALATRERGTPDEIVEQYLLGNPKLLTLADIALGAGLQEGEIGEAVRRLSGAGRVKQISGDGKVYLLPAGVYRRWVDEICALLNSYHEKYPLREGYSKEELRSRKYPSLSNKTFMLLMLEMEKDCYLRVTPQAVALKSFNSGPDPGVEKQIFKIRKILEEAAFQPPSWAVLCHEAGVGRDNEAELLQYLLRAGEMLKVAEDLYFQRNIMLKAREKVAGYLREKGEITVGEVRDLLNTSRKYALPLLEYFDREKVTRRVGDKRLPGRALKTQAGF